MSYPPSLDRALQHQSIPSTPPEKGMRCVRDTKYKFGLGGCPSASMEKSNTHVLRTTLLMLLKPSSMKSKPTNTPHDGLVFFMSFKSEARGSCCNMQTSPARRSRLRLCWQQQFRPRPLLRHVSRVLHEPPLHVGPKLTRASSTTSGTRSPAS